MKSVLAQVETHREDAFLWLLYIKLFLALGVDLRESTVCALIDCCLENAKEPGRAPVLRRSSAEHVQRE